jgi:GMP synthase-like glutamine amidotransferase
MESNDKVKESNDNQILLIDNYSYGFPTDRIKRIESIVNDCLADVTLKVVHYTQFKNESAKEFIGIILSGSDLNVSSFYYNYKLKKRFEEELKLIRSIEQTPILAICFGIHLVAYSYGAQVCRMRITGLDGDIIFIVLKEIDPLITHNNIPVDVHHRDFVSPNDCEIQNNFDIKSISRTKGYKIVQYMIHKSKPIYSMQFHPETHNPLYFHSGLFDERVIDKARVIGKEIIENFLWMCLYKSNY